MEIYNKGKRTIKINREDFLSELPKNSPQDSIGIKFASIHPDTVCTIKDEVAKKLMVMYPGEIVRWGREAKAKR